MKFKYQRIFIVISLVAMCGGLLFFTVKPARKAGGDGNFAPDSSQSRQEGTKAVLQKTEDAAYGELFRRYYEACIANDMDALEECVSNINMVDEEGIQKRFQYVEQMQNLECYVAPGAGSDTFVVYVYGEMKIKGIQTAAPTLSVFLVSKTYDDRLIVYLNAVGEDEITNMEELNKGEEVLALIAQVNDKLNQALEQDTTLKEFVERLQ